jgi:hypothetical protein
MNRRKEMANNWGENRTGFDKELFDLGTVLQNVGTLNTIQNTVDELKKIISKMQEKNRQNYLDEKAKNWEE